jgi:hypothetical protein
MLIFGSFSAVANTVTQVEAEWVKNSDGQIDGKYRDSDSSVVFKVLVNGKEIEATYRGKIKPSVMGCHAVTMYGTLDGEVFRAVDLTSGCEENIQMATGLRSNGKIYVVLAVVSVILIGLLVYLVLTNKKLNNLKELYEEG